MWCIELHGLLNQREVPQRNLQAGCGRSRSPHYFTSHFTTSPIHHFTDPDHVALSTNFFIAGMAVFVTAARDAEAAVRTA